MIEGDADPATAERERFEAALRDSERRYHDLVEYQAEGFGVVDLEDRFLLVNPAAEKTFGVPPGTLVGMLVMAFTPPDSVSTLKEQNLLRQQGQASSYELLIRRPDGAQRTLLVTATPKTDDAGTLVGTLGVFRDITERKEMEAALRLAKTAADAANDAKSAFLANMSHEIRTPLNAVLGFVHLLRDTPLTAQQQDYLDKVAVSARDLHGIINDILDFSKIEAGRVNVEQIPFALGETLDNLAGTLFSKVSEKGLRLTLDLEPGLPPVLLGDPLRLGQVLRNLGSNAVKFTAQGEVKISVTGQPTPEGATRISFQVADSGIGMSPGELASLFQPFTQADDSTTRRFGGTGLGLAISRRLARLMGGDITVASQPGLGSSFTLTLDFQPAQTLPAIPVAVSLTKARLLAGASLLLVEDNPLNRQLAVVILQKAGAAVTVALDGAEAVEKVCHGRFDAVVMDLQLPLLGGYEATRRIRRCPGGATLPIIALTADAVVEVREKVLAAGMNDCLTKPIDPQLLVQTVASHLQPNRAGQPEPGSGPGPGAGAGAGAGPGLGLRPGPVPANPGEAPGPMDWPAAGAALEALRASLERDEVQARQDFTQLEALLRGGPLEETLAPLRRPIETYAYPQALKMLGAVADALAVLQSGRRLDQG